MLLTAEVSMVIVGALCLRPAGLGDGDTPPEPVIAVVKLSYRYQDLFVASTAQPEAQSLGRYLVTQDRAS